MSNAALTEINQPMVPNKKLDFRFLPSYADFLLRHKLKEMAAEQLRLSRELEIPILQYFSHYPDEMLLKLGEHNLRALLNDLAQNKASEYIEKTVHTWVKDQLPHIPGNQIQAEDISLLNFIRRKLFRDFLADYTHDLQLSITLMEEMDIFLTGTLSLSFKTLMNIQTELHDQGEQIAHIGNWVWDLSGNTISWSNELFRIYEIEPRDRITYGDLAAFNHPDDAAMVQEQMAISRNTLNPHDFYYRIILENGRQKYLHARGQVVTDETGRPEKMFGTLQDVTARKKIELENLEHQHFIQKITDLTPSIIAVYNIRTGKYLFINRAIETLLGYSQDEVLENGIEFFMRIIHPDDLPGIQRENNEALRQAQQQKTEEIREFRYRMRHRNGTYRWFHTLGTVFERNKEKEVETVINISVDVSEQVLSSRELEKKKLEMRIQEERYHRMIDEVQDYAILLLSKEGIIEDWNQGAEKIKGYKQHEIVGKHFRIFYPPEYQKDKLPEKLIAHASAHGKAEHEGWRVRKDGTYFWGSILITALHNESGEVIGFSKVTRDLTQKKIADDNLQSYAKSLENKNLELEEKNKELESFSYIASHDLQEPLRKIRVWASRIGESETISDKMKGGIAGIENACIRMQSLIEGLLHYSRTNMVKTDLKPTDLNVVMNEVISDLSHVTEGKDIRIDRSVLPVMPVVGVQFYQLFSNIISNSIKYSKPGEPILIKIDCEKVMGENNPLQLAFAHAWRISISDNGIGFNPEYAEKIFELFRRLHDKYSYAGTGVGLAICKKIVEQHHGKIIADGLPGKGATFHIYLPAD